MSRKKEAAPKTDEQVKKEYGKAIGTDLFGETIFRDVLLRERFIEPPFTILTTDGTGWRNRKSQWRQLGIQSELGRTHLKDTSVATDWMKRGNSDEGGSIFDPSLCEVLYYWFCPPKGKILDPFAGGSVRGIVAAYLGYTYHGIDIRREQVESNEAQARAILATGEVQPKWICGDSNVILDGVGDGIYDFFFSCPPYADLEKYSDLPGDISNMEYAQFIDVYGQIIAKGVNKLKPGSMACFVVGEVRDKNGVYYGFVPDTITLFAAAGMDYYNEAILVTSRASAVLRTKQFVASQKLIKCHQNILVFRKPT